MEFTEKLMEKNGVDKEKLNDLNLKKKKSS